MSPWWSRALCQAHVGERCANPSCGSARADVNLGGSGRAGGSYTSRGIVRLRRPVEGLAKHHGDYSSPRQAASGSPPAIDTRSRQGGLKTAGIEPEIPERSFRHRLSGRYPVRMITNFYDSWVPISVAPALQGSPPRQHVHVQSWKYVRWRSGRIPGQPRGSGTH